MNSWPSLLRGRGRALAESLIRDSGKWAAQKGEPRTTSMYRLVRKDSVKARLRPGFGHHTNTGSSPSQGRPVVAAAMIQSLPVEGQVEASSRAFKKMLAAWNGPNDSADSISPKVRDIIDGLENPPVSSQTFRSRDFLDEDCSDSDSETTMRLANLQRSNVREVYNRVVREAVVLDEATAQQFLEAISKYRMADLLPELLHTLSHQGFTGQTPGFYSRAILTCGMLGRLEDARVFYESAIDLFDNPAECHDRMIRALSHNKRMDEAFDVLNAMMQYDMEVSPRTLGALFPSVPKADTCKPVALLNEIRRRGIVPTDAFFSAVITYSDNPWHGWQLLDEIRDLKKQCGEIVYTSLLRVCAKHNDASRASKTFQRMQADDVKPTLLSVTALCETYVRSQGKVLDAFDIYDNLDKFGVKPTSKIFALLCEAAARIRDDEKAKMVFRDAVEANVSMDRYLRYSLLHAFRQTGLYDEIVELHKLLAKDPQFKPHPRWYSKIIAILTKAGENEKATMIYEEMKAYCETVPDSSMSLVAACAALGDVEQAYSTYEGILASGQRASVWTYNHLIEACRRSGKQTRAMDILREMSKHGVEPNAVTFNSLMSLCSSAGEAERAFSLFRQMKSKGINPNTITFNILIDACSKANGVSSAFDILEMLQGVGIRPGSAVFERLLDICMEGGEKNRALELFDEMKVNGLKATPDNYAALIMAFVKNSDVEQAWSVYNDMKNAKVQANSATYSSLIDLLWHAGSVDRAMMLFEESVHADIFETHNSSYTLDLHFMSRGVAQASVLYSLRQIKRQLQSPDPRASPPLQLRIITGVGNRSKLKGVSVVRLAVMSLLRDFLRLRFGYERRNRGLMVVPLVGHNLDRLEELDLR